MTQNGLVVELTQQSAVVEFARSDACEKCGACHMGKQKLIRVPLLNTADAQVGDTVEVALHATKFAKASAIVYVFPLMAFLAGLWAGPSIQIWLGVPWQEELFSCTVALVFMAAVFLVIRLTDRRRYASGEFAPQMLRVVQRNNSPG